MSADWPKKRQTMCSECGDLLTYVSTFADSLSVARDHVLDAHRTHPDPWSIVFCDYYGATQR